MSSQPLLQLWLLVVALLRLFSIYIALNQPETLAQTLFAAAPRELNPTAARIFAAWTATTCVLCLLCVYEGANPNEPIYAATAWSFAVALAVFIPELHSTMTWHSIAPAFVATTSLVWMAAARWKPKFSASLILKLGCAHTIVVEAHMVTAQRAEGWPGRLDTYLWWDDSTVRALLSDLGAAGRANYVSFYTHPLGDLALPFGYGMGLSALCYLRFSKRKLAAAALPLLAGICDIVENLSVLTILVEGYPPATSSNRKAAAADYSSSVVQQAIAVGPKATLAKWALLVLTGALLVGSAVGSAIGPRLGGGDGVEEREGPVSPLRERMRQARKSMKDLKRE